MPGPRLHSRPPCADKALLPAAPHLPEAPDWPGWRKVACFRSQLASQPAWLFTVQPSPRERLELCVVMHAAPHCVCQSLGGPGGTWPATCRRHL